MAVMESVGETQPSAESFALEHTPTWAVAVVCIVFIAVSLVMQRGLQRLGTWLLSSHKKSLYEALEKMKEELMLLGFISLLLTAAQNPISRMCMPEAWADEMLPCHFKGWDPEPQASNPAPTVHTLVRSDLHRRQLVQMFQSGGYAKHAIRKILRVSEGSRRLLSGMSAPHVCPQGHVPILSPESLHQLHIFIFVMAVVHVFYSCFTMLFSFTQLRSWRKWEEETNVDNYNYTDEIKKSFNEEAFRKITFRKMGLGSLRRQSTFVTSRTKNPWSTNPYGIWFNSFFRQFGKSVAKSDYLTLRLGFIKNHNAPMKLNFHKYIMNSLQDDLKTVIGISGYLWVFVIFFMILNVHGWYAYFWMSFIPVLINLVIGTKLQHIITQLALETAREHGLVAEPIKPRDELFWFNNPHLLLYLIHFVLFQNAFELAFCIWLVTTFGFNSCFFDKHGFIISRVIVGILAQVLCSYSTLPLYALVSQMGSHYKKAIFADPVSNAVTDWRNKAKANIRHLRQNTPHDHKKGSCDHLSESEESSHGHMNPLSEIQSIVSTLGHHNHPHHHGDDHSHHFHGHHHHNCVQLNINPPCCGEEEYVDHLSTLDACLQEVPHDTTQIEAPQTQNDQNSTNLREDLNLKPHMHVPTTIKSDPVISATNKETCRECGRLGLVLHMDKNDTDDSIDINHQTCSSLGGPIATTIFSPRSQRAPKGAKKVVYLKISSEEMGDGSGALWHLECGECKSLRTLHAESSVSKIDEENHQLNFPSHQETQTSTSESPKTTIRTNHCKKRTMFLKMTSEHQDQDKLSNSKVLTKGPSLDRMRRLPSRELREIRAMSSESGPTMNTFRPELNIPELMMCSSLVSEPFEMIGMTKIVLEDTTTKVEAISTSSLSSSGEIQPQVESTSFQTTTMDYSTKSYGEESLSNHEVTKVEE